MKKLIIQSIFVFVFVSNLYSQPSKNDYIIGYGSLAVFSLTQFPLFPYLAPQESAWKIAPETDIFFRKKLKWQNKNLRKAAFYSDILLDGIFLPSVFWTPLLSKEKYAHHLLLNIEVASATGILTNLAKFITGRQRPYSYYSTLESEGLDDYLSFFSGHTSLTFAIATSTSMIFEKKEPQISGLIWSSSIALAALTGYLRIAGDKHYMTDVLTGVVLGSLTGYLITEHQQKRFFKNKSTQNFQLTLVLPIR
ncbi:MAG: phosphatase PAP2 family protein [Calditrichaeota bacterium]|nr:phosphatase PAP2 family protein [Calditrichota bacterium]